jgi:hypothetical protein
LNAPLLHFAPLYALFPHRATTSTPLAPANSPGRMCDQDAMPSTWDNGFPARRVDGTSGAALKESRWAISAAGTKLLPSAEIRYRGSPTRTFLSAGSSSPRCRRRHRLLRGGAGWWVNPGAPQRPRRQRPRGRGVYSQVGNVVSRTCASDSTPTPAGWRSASPTADRARSRSSASCSGGSSSSSATSGRGSQRE